MIDIPQDAVFDLTDDGISIQGTDDVLFKPSLFENGDYVFKDGIVYNNKDEKVVFDNDLIESLKDHYYTPEYGNTIIDGVQYNLDKEGNALSEDGTIFKTVDELKDFKEAVLINDKEYILDAEGNALNEDGTVFMKADEIAKLNDEPEGINFSNIMDITNIKMLDKDGKPVEYDQSEEGIAQLVTDAFNKGQSINAESSLMSVIKKYPQIYDAIQYAESKGSLDGFNTSTDDVELKLDTEDKDSIKSMIIKGKMAKGESIEEATAIADFYAEKGKDIDIAKSELKYLKELQAQKNVEKLKLAEDMEKETELDNINTWGVSVENGKLVPKNIDNSIYNKVVTDKKLKLGDKEIIIPKVIQRKIGNKVITATPENFFDYIYTIKPFIINGQTSNMTQYDYDEYMDNSKKGVDGTIVKALQMFTGDSFSDIINRNISRQQIRNIKRVVSNSKVTEPAAKRILFPSK